MEKILYFPLSLISFLCFPIIKLNRPSFFISFQNLKRMNFIFILVLLSMMTESTAQNNYTNALLLKTINYDLDVQVDYDNNKTISICGMTIKNINTEESKIIPLLLYRLMKVTSIKDEQGNPMIYIQKVLSFEDWEIYQANYIEVIPAKPLLKGDTCKLIIAYEGYHLGYTETGMNYIRDRIDADFTILRPDCLAYPELGYPSEKINRAAGYAPSFNYTIKIYVPDTLVVVNGGTLISKENKDGFSTYIYQNTKLAWRIDVVIGKYKILETHLLKVYYLEKDLLVQKLCINMHNKHWIFIRNGGAN